MVHQDGGTCYTEMPRKRDVSVRGLYTHGPGSTELSNELQQSNTPSLNVLAPLRVPEKNRVAVGVTASC